MGFWHIIDPVERRNLITNPSFEYGTADWTQLESATLGTTSNVQTFGAWAGSIVPGANGTAGARGPLFNVSNGSVYAWSVYGSFSAGSQYRIGIGDSGGNTMVGSYVLTGGGTWHRYVGSWTSTATSTRRLTIRKESIGAAGTNFYLDGHQVEQGSLTTYIDGDRGAGYLWDGAPHASSSLRSADARTGGSVIPLSDIGMYVMESPGMGMPELTNVMQDYANIDGAFYQRTRAGARSLTLVTHIPGTTWQHFHAQRQRIINLVKPDRTPTQQPMRLLYSGAGGTLTIDAVYDGGLTFGRSDGFTENAAIKLIAPDPYWYSETEDGTALAAQVNLGSTNFLAYRNPQGQWGTMGNNGSSVNAGNAGVQALLYDQNGTLFIGGTFTWANGTQAIHIAQYVNNAFGTLVGGTLTGNYVRSLAKNSAGTLFVGGDILTANGTAGRYVFQWNGEWGSLPNGTISAAPNVVFADIPGTLFVGGNFTSFAGTSRPYAAMHTGNAWGSLTNGTVNAQVRAFAYTGGSLIVGGWFGSAGGTIADSIALWNGSWGTFANGGVGGANTLIESLDILPDTRIVIGGGFTSVSASSGTNVALANMRTVMRMGQGLGTSEQDSINVVQTDARGRAWAGGYSTITGPIPSPAPLFRWNGANWIPSDLTLPPFGIGNGVILAIALPADGGLYIGGQFSGTATAAAIGTVIVTASANTYPSFRLRNTAGTPIRIWQIVNTMLDVGLYFNMVMDVGENITITTTPGSASMTSSVRGNIIDRLLPGSNLAAFRLAPGTNYISFFADNASLRTDLIYRPAYWSSDGTP